MITVAGNALKALAYSIFLLLSLDAKGVLKMELSSPAFENNTPLPVQYTCDGKNINPPLSWQNVPDKTESFTLIVDDPDAPGKVFVHWVVYNLPATIRALEENVSNLDKMGALQGTNDFGNQNYGGACPPKGNPHHYHFTLYALDTILNKNAGLTKQDVLKAIDGHIIAQTELIGTYARR